MGEVTTLQLDCRVDVATAIHLLHYLECDAEIESALRRIFDPPSNGGSFGTMIANPEFDLDKHDASDSKTKFGYYFSLAESGNGGPSALSSGRIEKERELTLELRRWQCAFINDIAADVGFTAERHDPFISTEGLETYGAAFFEIYLANPQGKSPAANKDRVAAWAGICGLPIGAEATTSQAMHLVREKALVRARRKT